MKKILMLGLIITLISGCTIKTGRNDSSSENDDERYLSAAQLYSSITTFFPDQDIEKANSLYLDLLACIRQQASDFEYSRKKELLLNSVLNLHNNYEATIAEYEQMGLIPIKLEYINGSVYVSQNSERSSIPIYSEITKINDENILDYLSNTYPSIYKQCRSEADFNYLLSYLEEGKLNKTIRVSYVDDDGTETQAQLSYEKGQRWINSDYKADISYINYTTNYAIGLLDDIIYIKANNFTAAPSLDPYIKNCRKNITK